MSNCTSCGLCCIFYPSSVEEGLSKIDKNELININPNLYKKRKKGEGYYFLSIKDPYWDNHKRCKSLNGMQCNDVSCNIYKNRPSMCSDFKESSIQCNHIRYWGGLSPLGNNYINSINELDIKDELKRLSKLKIILEDSFDLDKEYYIEKINEKIQNLKEL